MDIELNLWLEQYLQNIKRHFLLRDKTWPAQSGTWQWTLRVYRMPNEACIYINCIIYIVMEKQWKVLVLQYTSWFITIIHSNIDNINIKTIFLNNKLMNIEILIKILKYFEEIFSKIKFKNNLYLKLKKSFYKLK